MVVPMENMRFSKPKSKQYVGNGLDIHLQENNSRVTVIGNDCTIKIDSNNGVLKVIGNACTIRVPSGGGQISYNGNEGCIRVGPEVNLDRVAYLGNEGKILREVPSTKESWKTEEVPVERCRSSVRSFNVINKSHKHISVGESVCSLAFPGILAVPHVTGCVINIRRNKRKS